jgi:hypothetical protein
MQLFKKIDGGKAPNYAEAKLAATKTSEADPVEAIGREERNTVLNELDRNQAKTAATIELLDAKHRAAELEASKARDEFVRRMATVSEIYAERHNVSCMADLTRGRLERRLRDLGNAAVLNAIRIVDHELVVTNSLRTYRDGRIQKFHAVEDHVWETTSRQVLDHHARLQQARPLLVAILTARDLSPAEVAERVKEISEKARLGQEPGWNPHARVRTQG